MLHYFFVCIQCEVNAETAEPFDTLTPEVISWLSSLNCNFTKVSEVIANKPKEVFDAIQKGIDAANKKAISNAQKIQKFSLLPVDFSLTTGELGKLIKEPKFNFSVIVNFTHCFNINTLFL